MPGTFNREQEEAITHKGGPADGFSTNLGQERHW